MNEQEELVELLKSIKNRCEIALFLISSQSISTRIEGWIPTVLEDMYCDCQAVIDNYCIKDK